MTQRPRPTRRTFLRGLGATSLLGTAGCLGRGAVGREGSAGRSPDQRSGDHPANGRDEGRSMEVAILAAGSLQHALEQDLKPAIDVPIEIEAHGSATVARLIAEGKRDPDIVTVADTALFDAPLSPPWYSEFTSNALVLGYNPDSDGGQRIADAGTDGWYEPLLSGDVRLGRTDPNQDPLGYRTLFVLELAARYYDVPNLGERILSRDQIYPETALTSQFEIGSIDAAVLYRNMAVERGYDYVTLPDELNLSNPAFEADWYTTASYTLPSDRTIHGGLISYGSTIRKMSEAALRVFARHTTGSYLEESGFLLRESFPAYTGDVPEAVLEATDTDRYEPLESKLSDITLLH
ncbi:extracellular solute-binding protein [Haloferax namakaokahaiae]|uniref:Extracellular solute-binding protein n=1 Tax=Haloferax namakaokahaiae TaxID=1748331 RepID=A0ABD5ZD44_9EURY